MLSLRVNGKAYNLDVEPETPLLWVIRDTIGLTGTKFGCGMALCGACTVHLNGNPVRSCVTRVSQAAGQEITTIEGLSADAQHPAQIAWREGAAIAVRLSGRPWESLAGKSDIEVGPWLMIAPDDTVTIRVGQSEMGQGVITSCAKMVAEELECDWSKVRAEYVSVNRHFRENKVYKRLVTTSSSSVRLGRPYLQQAGASARERLMAAAAQTWSVPRSELTVKDGVITHKLTGRTLRYGQVAEKAAAIKLPAEPKIKTPDQYTLMKKSTK